MARQEIDQLMDRWSKDAAFRTNIRKDPEGTVRSTGVQLTAEEWKAFRNIDWKLSDEQLKERANKLFA